MPSRDDIRPVNC